jgi:hypothetical protein
MKKATPYSLPVTVINAITAIMLILVIMVRCTRDQETLSGYQREVVSYFKDVALGFELGSASHIVRKWDHDMKIFVGGDPSPAMTDELNRIIDEINQLTSSDGFDISITADTLQSNCYLFFGAGTEFAKVIPFAASDISVNLGLFYVYFDGEDNLDKAVVYVDILRVTDGDIQKHLLREELTQSLGLARDSERYPESIFQQDWTHVTEYAPIDRELIRLLYHPEMSTGLDENSVEPVLEKLVVDLNISK